MLLDYFPLIAALLSNVLAQVLKPFFKYRKTKKFDIYQMLASGGFPSSHTSTVSALAMSFALKDGLSSNAFIISFILMLIISYDAMNVRLYAGRHIELTQQLINDLKELQSMKFDAPIYFAKMKQILGHERFEVFGGFVLGIIISILLYFVLGGF